MMRDIICDFLLETSQNKQPNERKKNMLFEVAILEKPTKKEIDDEGKTERLVFGPKAVVANDAQSAAIAAVLDGEKIEVDRSRMTVLVRPFA
jgi:hypothetical protein